MRDADLIRLLVGSEDPVDNDRARWLLSLAAVQDRVLQPYLNPSKRKRKHTKKIRDEGDAA